MRSPKRAKIKKIVTKTGQTIQVKDNGFSYIGRYIGRYCYLFRCRDITMYADTFMIRPLLLTPATPCYALRTPPRLQTAQHGHICPYMAIYWPYMAIYGQYIAIYGHIWPYMAHIWAHTWPCIAIYGPYVAIYGPYMTIYGHIESTKILGAGPNICPIRYLPGGGQLL